MGKSFKKHPFTGVTTAKSEKKDKRITNKKVRHKVKQTLNYIKNEEEIEENIKLYLDKKDVSDVWSFAKDGKSRIDKSSRFYKKAIRK